MKRLVLAVLCAGVALAEDAPRIVIRQGEERPMNTVPRWQPNCDDPSVAWISADGKAILKGVKPGKTLCSLADDGGRRFVWEVVVAPGEKSPAR